MCGKNFSEEHSHIVEISVIWNANKSILKIDVHFSRNVKAWNENLLKFA